MPARLLAAPAVSPARATGALVTKLDDTVTPVVADRFEEELRMAERERHMAYLIEMDPPDGSPQPAREIVQTSRSPPTCR